MNKNTRKLSITALAISAVIGLSACSATPTQQTPQDRTAPSVTQQAPTGWTYAEQSVIDGFDRDVYVTTAAEEVALIDLSWTVCDSLDAGMTVEDVIVIGIESGTDPFESGYIVGGAIEFLCPQHLDAADDFISQYDTAGQYA